MPIDESYCRVRMARAIDQRKSAAAAAADRAAFFKIGRGDVDDGQSLLRGFVDLATQMTHGEFTRGQPIGSLAPVAKQRDLGLHVKPPYKIRAEAGPMIENQHRRQQRRATRILAEKFSFPLGLEQIPIRLDLTRA